MREDDPRLTRGRWFEEQFARKAKARGLIVIPHCSAIGFDGIKAPMAAGLHQGYRLPDLTVINPKKCSSAWTECKLKTTAPLYRIAARRQHGIDQPCWDDYLALTDLTQHPGFLVIGELDTGEIRIARFDRLRGHEQVQAPCSAFPQGAVFWPRDWFTVWDTFDVDGVPS